MHYSDAVQRHFRQPARGGRFPPGTPGVCGAAVGDPARGGRIVLQLQVDAAGRIRDARFLAYGCGVTLAAASWISDWLPGRSLAEAVVVRDAPIREALDLPAEKLHCAVLAAAAARSAAEAALGHRDHSLEV